MLVHSRQFQYIPVQSSPLILLKKRRLRSVITDVTGLPKFKYFPEICMKTTPRRARVITYGSTQGDSCSFRPLPSASCAPPGISLAMPGPGCCSSHREAHNLPGLEGIRSLFASVFEGDGFALVAPFSLRSMKHTRCLLLLRGVSKNHGFLPHLTTVEPLRNSHRFVGFEGRAGINVFSATIITGVGTSLD